MDPARLVHHAYHAGDTDAVLHWAPIAAAGASSVGAYRQAAKQALADYFKVHYGPTLKAFEALGDQGKALFDGMVELATRFNSATDGTLKVRSQYAEVIAVRA